MEDETVGEEITLRTKDSELRKRKCQREQENESG
jgi:hypothetical protein